MQTRVAPDKAEGLFVDTQRRSDYTRRQSEQSPPPSDATRGSWKEFFDPTFSKSMGFTLVKIIWFVALGVTVLGLLVFVFYLRPVEWLLALIVVGALLDLFVVRLALEVARAVLQIRDASLQRARGEQP